MLGMAGLGGAGMAGSGFTVTPDEAAKFQVQFNSLPVVQGKLNGDAARTFFMRSGLPAQELCFISFTNELIRIN